MGGTKIVAVEQFLNEAQGLEDYGIVAQALGFLNRLVTLVSTSNLYLEYLNRFYQCTAFNYLNFSVIRTLPGPNKLG